MGIPVSLVTVAEGATYQSFVKPWRESILRMNRKPDEIVIVIGSEDSTKVRSHDWSNIPTKIIELNEPFSNHFFNAATDAATSEWISYCGIDDLMLPDAYIDLDNDTDISVGSVMLDEQTLWEGTWDKEFMKHFNPLPAHSLYKRALWEKVGGYPDIRWSDWGFWLRCAQTNPKVSQGKNPVAIFDTGEGRETMSGLHLDPAIRATADLELHNFRLSLE